MTGALTRGDRRAATGADLSQFNFDTPYGRSSLQAMYNAICQVCLSQHISALWYLDCMSSALNENPNYSYVRRILWICLTVEHVLCTICIIIIIIFIIIIFIITCMKYEHTGNNSTVTLNFHACYILENVLFFT